MSDVEKQTQEISEKISAMMSAHIGDCLRDFGTLIENLTETKPIGAIVTANLTSFVQVLAVSAFENGRTAEEAKQAMTSAIAGMEEYIDELFVGLSERKATAAKS